MLLAEVDVLLNKRRNKLSKVDGADMEKRPKHEPFMPDSSRKEARQMESNPFTNEGAHNKALDSIDKENNSKLGH